MNYGEQQKQEIATVRERGFKINLSDADVDRLAMKAAQAGMSMGELLASFIGDLVCGTYSNGSDERMYAEQWYERCGFSFYPSNDIARLAKSFSLESMVDYCKDYQEAIDEMEAVKQDLASPDCDDITEEDLKDAEDSVSECRKDILSLMDYADCKGTLEQVVVAVLKWSEDLEAFKAQK